MENNLQQDYLKRKASTFLKFDKMITPSIIQVIFYIGLALGLLVGLINVFAGITSNYGGGIQVLFGLIIMVVAPLFIRLWCELTIVIFKIHEALEVIKNK